MRGTGAWVAAGLALLNAACGGSDAQVPQASLGDLRVYDARIPAPPADVAALYLRVVDAGGDGDRLTAVSSPTAGHAMLHETRREGDRVRMLPAAGGLRVPAGGALELRPGGAHAMLMQLRRPLREGDRIPVELVFERAGRLGLEVPVVARAGGGGAHDPH
jgi:copper(I)-binding protein